MEETQPVNAASRQALEVWREAIQQNPYLTDADIKHSIAFYLGKECPTINQELTHFAERIVRELEPLVIENNLSQNLPRIEHYDGIGRRVEQVVHHPTYEAAGNIIYSSRSLERMAKPGGLTEALAFMFFSSQAGEAGHNCPVACSAGMIRVFQKSEDFPQKSFYLQKLIAPSYTENFTGAQFLTEIQGGSDVGQNATEAYRDEQGAWRIRGEKWFCSNADAELILLTARFDNTLPGTRGLGLFLMPAHLESGAPNHYTLRRLKDKIGTRSMASAEIDFHGAFAIAMGPPAEGFKMVMENVLHISRLFNSFCMLGMARRAYTIAHAYAQQRVAFGHPIIQYPLVQENLACIKAENTALLASIFATTKLQDAFDTGKVHGSDTKLLLRLMANLNKYLSALWSVEHIHHALDTLAGNGAIESFSTIPRLLRDSIVCENWEGTHNTLRMQILKDIERYELDRICLNYLETALSKMQPLEEYINRIKDGINQLAKNLQLFRAMTSELQSLHIKTIVDDMAILLAAVHLLEEALDQGAPSSKLRCLDYFLYLHVDQAEVVDHQRHLDLIRAIL